MPWVSFAKLVVTNTARKLDLINRVKMAQDIIIWKLHTAELIQITFCICIDNKEIQGQEREIKILFDRMDGPDFYVSVNRSASGSFLKDLGLEKLQPLLWSPSAAAPWGISMATAVCQNWASVTYAALVRFVHMSSTTWQVQVILFHIKFHITECWRTTHWV